MIGFITGSVERLHAALARFGAALGRVLSCVGRIPPQLRLAVCFLAMGAVAWAISAALPEGYVAWASFDEAQLALLGKGGELASAGHAALLLRSAAVACALAALVCWVRLRLVYRLLEAAYALWTLAVLGALRFAFAAPAALHDADYKTFDRLSRDALWTAATGAAVPVLVLGGLVLLLLSLSSVRRRYGIGGGAGDRILDGFRTGGADPRYRSSWYWSIGIFLFALAAPFVFRGCGWEEPYGLVKGSGQPEAQVVRIKKIKREKPKRKYMLNKWSPYILERAKVDDLKTFEELMETTEDTYSVDNPLHKAGKLGKGGGKTGGWPKGMEGAKVRFIRLEYDGGDWDQDMGRGADWNLLSRFHKLTGLPVWHETESRRVSRLAMFPKGKAPPFVFLTGSRGMRMSDGEIKTLRRYIVDEGGMLFIDNGGGAFGAAVRSLVSRLFPGRPFIDVPNDDPIYRRPFSFPDGAPPFWHHDGYRAKGVRIDGRLAVYYHPGDVNDAWKDGRSGASEAVAEQAFRLGVNVIYYAFEEYYSRHYGGDDRK